MKLAVHHTCADADTYRAARVKSLFNVSDQAIQAVELAACDELPRVEQDHAAASWEPAFTGGSLSGV